MIKSEDAKRKRPPMVLYRTTANAHPSCSEVAGRFKPQSPEEHDAVWADIKQNPESRYAQRVEKYGWSNFPLIDKVALNFFGKAIPNMVRSGWWVEGA